MIYQSSSSISGMEIVDLLESLHLHNTTYAGLQQKPGPHSHHPAALFSGRHHFPPRVPSTLVPWYSGTGVARQPGTHQFLRQLCNAGVERSVYYSRQARDRVASLIQSSKEFAFVTSIRSHNHISHISQSQNHRSVFFIRSASLSFPLFFQPRITSLSYASDGFSPIRCHRSLTFSHLSSVFQELVALTLRGV